MLLPTFSLVLFGLGWLNGRASSEIVEFLVDKQGVSINETFATVQPVSRKQCAHICAITKKPTCLCFSHSTADSECRLHGVRPEAGGTLITHPNFIVYSSTIAEAVKTGYNWCLAQGNNHVHGDLCIAVKLTGENTNFTDADAACKADGGQLPVLIDDQYREDVASTFHNDLKSAEAWLGFQQDSGQAEPHLGWHWFNRRGVKTHKTMPDSGRPWEGADPDDNVDTRNVEDGEQQNALLKKNADFAERAADFLGMVLCQYGLNL